MNQIEANEAISAAKGTISLGGTTFLVSPVTERIFATLSKWLRKRLADPISSIAASLAALPKHLQEIAVREAVQLKAGGGVEMTKSYVEQQLYEPEPCAFLVWLLIKESHPSMTHEQTTKLVQESGVENVLSELYEAAGLKGLEGNENGPIG